MNTSKCRCTNCAGKIAFETERAGEAVTCPHCGKSTQLFVPVENPPTSKRRTRVIYLAISILAIAALGATALERSHIKKIEREKSEALARAEAAELKAKEQERIRQDREQAKLDTEEANLRAQRIREEAAARENETLAAMSDIAKREKQEKLNYIKTGILLYEAQASYHKSEFEGEVPGVDFKIKNIGSRVLSRIEVTVSFFDQNGKIAEEIYHPVHASTPPLKPNFIWQIERGKFYIAKNVPNEWVEGAVKFFITDITFAE